MHRKERIRDDVQPYLQSPNQGVIYILSGHPNPPADAQVIEALNAIGITVVVRFVDADTLPDTVPSSGSKTRPTDRLTIYKFPAPKYVVAFVLTLYELADSDPETATNRLTTPPFEDAYTEYREWMTSLTYRDRQLRLLDSAEAREDHPLVDHHLSVGEYRQRPEPSTETRKFIGRSLKPLNWDEVNPNKCYEACLNFLYWTDDRDDLDWDRISYCEGLALPQSAARAGTHAWLEFDGIPVELTWPWHRPYDADIVYFGAEVSEDVLETVFDRTKPTDTEPFNPPISVSDDIRTQLHDLGL